MRITQHNVLVAVLTVVCLGIALTAFLKHEYADEMRLIAERQHKVIEEMSQQQLHNVNLEEIEKGDDITGADYLPEIQGGFVHMTTLTKIDQGKVEFKSTATAGIDGRAIGLGQYLLEEGKSLEVTWVMMNDGKTAAVIEFIDMQAPASSSDLIDHMFHYVLTDGINYHQSRRKT